MSFGPAHVVIVGGGAAALETCLALRARAGDSVLVTVVAPNTYFAYRPVGGLDPLGICGHVRVPLAHAARAAGADLRHDRMTEVDTARRRIYTAAGYELAYDALVVAIGATPLAVPAGSVAFDPRRIAECRSSMHAVERGDLGSLAFVEPAGPTQALELYDLVLETAVSARREGASPALTLVTAQRSPLAVAGARAADTLRLTLASHGVRVVESAHLRAIVDCELDLVPGPHRVFAGRAIVAPRLGGRYPVHLPWDTDGFLPTDPLGRVQGIDGVFAAGDCTAFPVKHPSIAAQQADAVAAAIAGDPQPFEPVLRCMLPSRLHWYLEAPLTGGHGDATRISAHPLWPGDARFGSRYLTPWLAELQHRGADDGRGHASNHHRVHDTIRAAAAVASH
jgi:NADH dehydrogenase FAD-containing subunit